MDYRSRMRELREDNDLTQAVVARVISKSQQGYSHIENGRAELKIDDLILLCNYYNVSSDYFIGLCDDMRYLYKKKVIAAEDRDEYGK